MQEASGSIPDGYIMEISTKEVYEIGIRDKEIYIQYKTKEDVFKANKKLMDDILGDIDLENIF